VPINPFVIAGDDVDVDLERAVQFGGLAEGDVLIDISITSKVRPSTIHCGATTPPMC
jgi:hypothetical protein